MELNISNTAKAKVDNAILIAGSARSGTTIIGKIVHSFKGVEYVFEPPMLFSLIPLIEKIETKTWKLLYETYLYEEFFINAISGRAINCNRSDDSSIFRVKPFMEVEARLEKSFGKNDAEIEGRECVIAYKIPDIVPYIPKLQEYFPRKRVIIVKRDAIGVINSLLAKKWFSSEKVDKNLIWPFIIYKGLQIPFWVKEKDYDRWVEMPEIDRCAYYYIRVNEDVRVIKNRIEIKYNDLLNDPVGMVKQIATALQLKFGEKTEKIISEIKPTERILDHNLFCKITKDLSELAQYYSELS